MPFPLQSLHIINTRPAHQAHSLNQQLHALGATTIPFPCLEIHPFGATELLPTLQALSSLHNAIFLSANAVHTLMPLWPTHLQPLFIAIGPATAKALQTYTQQPIIHPTDYNSQGLLTLPALQRKNQITLLACSATNHSALINTLKQRQHQVIDLPCYKTQQPTQINTQSLEHKKKSQIIISTSLQSLTHLLNIVAAHKINIAHTPILVINNAMKTMLAQHAWQAPILLSPDATDSSIIQTLIAHRHQIIAT